MRAVIAMMKHETNTFSPVPTPLSRFGRTGPFYGADAAAAYRGTNTAMAAFMELCDAAGAVVDTPIAANARPSGRLPKAVYESMADAICEAVGRGCDAVFLDLHGAMVAEHCDDGEGELLRRIRSIQPDLPIAVALDMHANLTEEMVANCTVLAGYRTYPHVDMHETGLRAGRLLLRSLTGEIAPAMVWDRLPLLVHTLRMGTAEDPFRELVAQAKAIEQEGMLDVSVFGGFALADIAHPCFAALVVADSDEAEARSHLEGLLAKAWQRRLDCVYESEPLAASIARAATRTDGPVLLIDHSDNCASGGTQDTTAVLAEALRQGLRDIAVFAICDPEAVADMISAGVGERVTLKLGGKVDMDEIGLRGEPLELTGRVRAITDGEFVVTGPMMTGTRAVMGRTAVLETEAAEIVVCERHHEPWDLGCLRSVGIEPTAKRYILLKSRMHYRAGFLPIAREIIECDGRGVTSSDFGLFRFRNLVRPVYPLDAGTTRTPSEAAR